MSARSRPREASRGRGRGHRHCSSGSTRPHASSPRPARAVRRTSRDRTTRAAGGQLDEQCKNLHLAATGAAPRRVPDNPAYISIPAQRESALNERAALGARRAELRRASRSMSAASRDARRRARLRSHVARGAGRTDQVRRGAPEADGGAAGAEPRDRAEGRALHADRAAAAAAGAGAAKPAGDFRASACWLRWAQRWHCCCCWRLSTPASADAGRS